MDIGLDNTALHRGATQLVKGCIWAVFATAMMVRSYRRYKLGWPIRWGLLVGIILACEAYSQIAHGIYWVEGTEYELHHWKLVAPLWISLLVSIWCMFRWIRIGRDDIDGDP